MINVAVPITGKNELMAIKKVIYSGKFVSGKYVEAFEKNFAKYVGTKFAVCLNSGTAALHAALSSLNLKKNDEVIVPSISFVSSATAILHNGCVPVFCDVNLNNYCLNVESLITKITKRTKVIIAVHFGGSACEMDQIMSIARKKKIIVIEDCSQAHGTKINNKKVGSIGNISCFSFYATKHMTTGEGGILCTNKESIYKYCKAFRSHGMLNRDTHLFLGYNYRMSEMNAAIGLEQLKKLDLMNSQRVKNSLYILRNLKKKSKEKKSWFQVQEPVKNIYHTYFWCPLRIIKKNLNIALVKKKLLNKGIEIRSRYKFPLYKQPVFQNLKIKSSQNYKKLFLKNSETLSGKIFGLPNHSKLTKNQMNYIIESVCNLFK